MCSYPSIPQVVCRCNHEHLKHVESYVNWSSCSYHKNCIKPLEFERWSPFSETSSHFWGRDELFSSYLVTSFMKICLHTANNSKLITVFTTHLQHIQSSKLCDCKYVTIYQEFYCRKFWNISITNKSYLKLGLKAKSINRSVQ